MRRPFRVLVAGCAASFTAFLALHWYLMATAKAEGGRLGALSSGHVLPIHAYLRPRLSLWIVPALLVGALYFLVVRRWTVGDPRPRAGA